MLSHNVKAVKRDYASHMAGSGRVWESAERIERWIGKREKDRKGGERRKRDL